MKTESTVMYILRLALTLLVITGVMAAALGAVNAVTEPIIAQINAEKTQKAISAVLDDAETAVKLDSFPNESGLVSTVYESDSGYALEVTPIGFDNTITMMVGVSKDGVVQGISIISHTETAGLGAVAASNTSAGEAFRSQFEGMSGSVAVSKDGGQVDALTGATITSRAVCTGINAALECVGSMG